MKPLFTLFILLFTLLYFCVVFYWSPLEINQGYVQKIMYLHVPSIFMAYLAIFGVFIFLNLSLEAQKLRWQLDLLNFLLNSYKKIIIIKHTHF